MTPTAIVIFASPAGRPIYISATPNPKAAVEAIRSRWDAATIAATFYAPAATEAHQIASAAAMALPIAERKAAIVLRDGGVDEARTLIAQLAKRQGVRFTTERELAADSKRQSDVAAVVTKLRGKQHIGELKPFNQACREQRDRLDGRFLSNDAMLRAVAEKIVAGRKIKTFDAALVEEILSELAEPAGAIPSAPKRTGAGIANVREPERFPHALLGQSSECSLDQLEPGRFQGLGVDLARLDHGLRAVLHDLQSSRRSLEGSGHQDPSGTLRTTSGITGGRSRHQVGGQGICAEG